MGKYVGGNLHGKQRQAGNEDSYAYVFNASLDKVSVEN